MSAPDLQELEEVKDLIARGLELGVLTYAEIATATTELDLDETLRQSVLTSLPLRPLCSATCPGLCVVCGQRLDTPHKTHDELSEQDPDDTATSAASPFARLAVLLRADQER